MINKKVLFISMYPIKNPQHGGQKRASALFDFYSKGFVETKFISIYHRAMYDNDSSSILLGDINIINEIDKNPYRAEFLTGEAMDRDINVRSAIGKILYDYKPDIIHIEQVFFYKSIRKILIDVKQDPLIVYGSQNVEYLMKKNILKNTKISKKKIDKIVLDIRNLETEAILNSDLVIVVSKKDLETYKKIGLKKGVIIPNGINTIKTNQKDITYWSEYIRRNNINKYALFIGSGHPPNWMGYLEMVGKDTSFLNSNNKIFIAGGVSEYFDTIYKKEDKDNIKFWANCIPLGKQTESSLAALIKKAEIIMLPITSGGGSNLKTAEAILSGKKIVSTSYAFRGYENFVSMLPNIFIADTNKKFISSIKTAFNSDYIIPNDQQRHISMSVMWGNLEDLLIKSVNKAYRHKFNPVFSFMRNIQSKLS